MKRIGTFLAVLLIAAGAGFSAAASEVQEMHPGSRGMGPILTPDPEWREPYQPYTGSDATYQRIFPERSGLSSNRDPSKDPAGGCRSRMANGPDAMGRIAHWRYTECLDANGNAYVLPGSQHNLGYLQ